MPGLGNQAFVLTNYKPKTYEITNLCKIIYNCKCW